MCGIAGIFQYQGAALDNLTLQSQLKSMGHRLRFRGPDDERYFIDEKHLGFVFRRLSIVDLAGGAQPFVSADGNIVVMVNGEIYNYESLRQSEAPDYPYQSKSDCEVILALYQKYGLSFLSKVNGMFGISIYDKAKGQLILIRDRLGIKPLYYAQTSEKHIIFGSEIKALAAHPECPRGFNWVACMSKDAMADFILNPLPASMFEGISSLDPGTYVVFDEKGTHHVAWWTFPTPKMPEAYDDDHRTVQNIMDGYHEILQDSVRVCLMSDVDVGCSLSGGIDSVAITTYASQIKPIDTFTVLCNSTFMNGDVKAAHEAAKHLNCPNHQLYFPWRANEINYQEFKRILYDVEMPINNEHLYKYLLYRKLKQDFPRIKTILMGQGSDEFNGGYCHEYIKAINKELNYDERNWDHFMDAMRRIKKEQFILQLAPKLVQYNDILSEAFVDNLFNSEAYTPWAFYQARNKRAVADYNLWHEDRMSSANMLENRVPFLDYRLVEFSLNIPPPLYKELFWNKEILRKNMEKYLPIHLAQREKAPFFFGSGLRYSYRMAYQLLTANNNECLNEAIFDNPYVKDVYDLPAIAKKVDMVRTCPSYEGSIDLLSFVCWGLLAKWISGGMPEPETRFADKLSWYTIKDWKKQESELAQQLLESPLGAKDVLDVNEKILILLDVQSKGDVYIIRDEKLEFVIEAWEKPELIQFFKAIDGKQSIDAIAHTHGFTAEKILPDLADAIEYGVLIKRY
ncbi:TPA: asparagine synthase (glutamine-hydrolyzing) [Legionella pneumophila]